ncbi:hypothetical protein ASG31_17670 [Chryseobacterium sp. Leaf404]|uniref:sce7726 family protein n=1 Tax=unclassified Chryseobacterium TaxID=2593645 RepID=UPI0006F447D0|nr:MULTISPECIES: sce7726 family protein [unclassified Chryseobacterium]KQT20258.1 hypothetical protein ASG31_17670 [Chryseobacterium sp. Leaf404]
MNDYKIRTAIKNIEFINHFSEPDTKVIDEMGLNLGSSIIDIAVINGTMVGYEIKSDHDTLNRLAGQILEYNKVFDFLNIVTSKKFASSIKEHVPQWWGIIEVEEKDSEIKIHQRRKARINKSVSSFSLLQLLWKEELGIMIDRYALPRSLKYKSKKTIWTYISEVLDIDIIKNDVRSFLKLRTSWKSV